MSITPKQFGNNLSALMSFKKINQTELSEQSGVTRQLINNYYCGRGLPNISRAMDLATALKVSLDALLVLPLKKPRTTSHNDNLWCCACGKDNDNQPYQYCRGCFDGFGFERDV